MNTMNPTTNLSLTIPMPQIARIDVVEHLVVRVTWSAGIRAGRTDVVDLSPMINSLKHYRPLRENRMLFRTTHLVEDGRVVAWGDDDQIDMAADSVEELAEETVSADEFRDFLKTYGLTHNEAAAYLDRSRRQIENYLSGAEPIPRIFVMACFGLVARKRLFRGSLTKLARMQVVDHAPPLVAAKEPDPAPTPNIAPAGTTWNVTVGREPVVGDSLVMATGVGEFRTMTSSVGKSPVVTTGGA
jgi:hypothetical protein